MPYINVKITRDAAPLAEPEIEKRAAEILKLAEAAEDRDDLYDLSIMAKELRAAADLGEELEKKISKALLRAQVKVKRAEGSEMARLARKFEEYIKWIYGGTAARESKLHDDWCEVHIWVPSKVTRPELESDIGDFCAENGCEFSLSNLTPGAPSPQYFSENLKLKYAKKKDFEALAKKESDLEIAKSLFKKSWGAEFDPENEDDREDIVLLYNEYMDELAEWNEALVRLQF